jgi:DNA repair exonuclease SbcCD ATPase subunit
MSIIHLEEVKIKNFLSYGSNVSTFKIDHGLTLISGQNKDTSRSNGAGKSGLNESIVWALFGKTIKDITKDQIVNWKNKKKCLVEISFSIDGIKYRIERGIKPNVLKIYKGDKELDSLASVTDFQKYLEEEILKIDYKTFISLFYYNPNNFVSIFDIPKAQKRKFLENIFNLEAYSDIKNKINKKVSNIDSAILENKTSVSKNEERISSLEINVSKYTSDIRSIDISDTHLQLLQEQLNDIPDDLPSKEDIEKYEQKIKDIEVVKNKAEIAFSEKNALLKGISYDPNAADKLEECKKNFTSVNYDEELEKLLYDECFDYKVKKESILSDLKKVSQKGQYEDLDNCPICGSKMNNESIREHKAKEKDRLNKELTEVEEKENLLISKHNDIKKSNMDYKYYESEIERLTKVIEENSKYLEIMESIKTLKETKEKFSNTVFNCNSKLKEMKERASLYNRDLLLSQIENEKNRIEERKAQIEKLEEYKANAISELSLLKSENVELKKKNTNLSLLKDYYSFLKKLCGDDQIKQYAISSLVPIINQRANHYLSEAAVGFYIKLDGWLDCEIKGAGISNATASSLSGGEKKSLELALQFALYDISKLKCKNLPNILILDEILDSSVDVKGIENLMNIVTIKQREDNLATFIVSHRKEISSFTFDRRFNIIKSNGYSSIKEEV